MHCLLKLRGRRFKYLRSVIILVILFQSLLLYKTLGSNGNALENEDQSKWKALFSTYKNTTPWITLEHKSAEWPTEHGTYKRNMYKRNINHTAKVVKTGFSAQYQLLPYDIKANIIIHNKVVLVGSNYNGEELVGLTGEMTPYVLVVPHFMDPVVNSINVLHPFDQQVLKQFVNILNISPNLDGVFGENYTKNSSEFLSHSPCQFEIRESTILVKNSGEIRSAPVCHQSCNLAQGAFLIRTKIFEDVQLKPNRGFLACLDFFIRSEGRLRLGKVGFTFSEDLNRQDRGLLKGTRDFTEYQIFGIEHGILRIIYEDRIEWTKCAAHWELCQEKPYIQPQTLPYTAMPICCSQCLDVFLQDATEALDKLGFEYRIIYGTLLGAVRSQAIIPWTFDVDIGVTQGNYWNETFYKKLQEFLGKKYWTGFSYISTYRMHPRFAPSLKADFSNTLRKNPDVLFTAVIRDAIGKLSPIVNGWRQRGYVDFYPSPYVWLNGSAEVTINGRKYRTLPQTEYELKNWYGKEFRTPILHGHWVGRTDLGDV